MGSKGSSEPAGTNEHILRESHFVTKDLVKFCVRFWSKFNTSLLQLYTILRRCIRVTSTVNSLLTHTSRWTAQAMGYKRVWVMRAGPKISLEKLWKNHPIYFSLNNAINERNYTQEKKSVNNVFFIDLVLLRQIFMLKDAKCASIFQAMGSFKSS